MKRARILTFLAVVSAAACGTTIPNLGDLPLRDAGADATIDVALPVVPGSDATVPAEPDAGGGLDARADADPPVDIDDDAAVDAGDASPPPDATTSSQPVCAGVHLLCEDFEADLSKWSPVGSDVAPAVTTRDDGRGNAGVADVLPSTGGRRIQRSLATSGEIVLSLKINVAKEPAGVVEVLQLGVDASHKITLTVGSGPTLGVVLALGSVQTNHATLTIPPQNWVQLRVVVDFGASGHGNVELNGAPVGAAFTFVSADTDPLLLVGPAAGQVMRIDYDDIVVN